MTRYLFVSATAQTPRPTHTCASSAARTFLCFIVMATSLIMPGCARGPVGFIVTDDGQMIADNAENQRKRVIENVRAHLDAQLGAHWRSDVTLAESPEYTEDDPRMLTGWRWAKASLGIDLVSDGGGAAAITSAEVRKQVTDFMSPKVEHPSRNLVVSIREITDGKRLAALAQPTTAIISATNNTAVSASDGSRRYTIQAGDTLADISTVFYGSPDHWRAIVNANPGLHADQLTPGTVIVIPAQSPVKNKNNE